MKVKVPINDLSYPSNADDSDELLDAKMHILD